MTRYLIAFVLVIAASLAGCDERVGDYVAASSIAKNGFASDRKGMRNVIGEMIQVWGFVDHGNLYGDTGAKRILQEWWAGDGPDAATWRFDLKSRAQDAVGSSFAIRVPNDRGRDDLLRRFVQDARAGRPTKVFLTGGLFTFNAPTQVRGMTGLYLELQSSQDVQCDAPD